VGSAGRTGAHRPQPVDEAVGDVQVLADVVPEVVDGLFALLVGHRDKLVHQIGLNGRAALFDQGPERRPPGPQGALLAFDHLQVRGEQVVQGGAAVEQAADLVQIGVQLAQGADKLQPGDGVDVVHPVAGLVEDRGLDEPGFAVEPDGADAQAAAARGVSDGIQLLVVHGATLIPQAA
jgi:hypothetical protein